jgi:hypothetical protein
MIDLLLRLPTWPLIRVAGLVSYYLMFIGIALGILYGLPSLRGKAKQRIYQWHSRFQSAGVLAVLVHVMLLAIDRYMPFDWDQLLIPFSYPQHRAAYGFGSLAMYGLLIILLTTDFRSLLPRRLWLAIHLSAYPFFLLAMLHGLFSGTDTREPLVFAGYVATAAGLVLLTVIRGIADRAKQAPSAPASASSRSRSNPLH